MAVRRQGFVASIRLLRETVPDFGVYPFDIPAVARLRQLRLDPRVTLLVGENGSGKSTLVEAIAVACGMNAEGGGRNFRFATRTTESPLHEHLRVAWHRRPRTDFFLRAETFYNVATQVEELRVGGYGDRLPHDQSHGESFLALVRHRFWPEGLYILDEPESALSPVGQMALLVRIHDLLGEGCQFVIATHSPLLMAFPGALIYAITDSGIRRTRYEDLETVHLYRTVLADPKAYMRMLLQPDG